MQLTPFSLALVLVSWTAIAVQVSAAADKTSLAASDNILRFQSKPRQLGRFRYFAAAFTNLMKSNNGSKTRYDLLLSSFGIRTSDVSVVYDIGGKLDRVANITPTSLNTNLKWPNQISAVPTQALSSSMPYMAVPDGFLVPGKDHGSLTLQPLVEGRTGHVISSGEGTWFYHRVLWHDMNKDGTLDALTCRANKPLFGPAKGEMLFFENPHNHSLTNPWRGQVLADGPDVLFKLSNITLPGQKVTNEVIVTTEYFNQRLRVFWTEDPGNDWSKTDMIKFRDIPIPKGSGQPFDVLIEDLDLDGKVELVVSFNSAKNGTVVIYEVPADFRTAGYKSHIVASGFHSVVLGPNTGGPGVLTLLPGDEQNKKPKILVSGDDSGRLSILEPTSSNAGEWDYKLIDVLDTKKSTIGGISAADVDGDGRLEVFAPSYKEGRVYIFKL